jgi:hypothetical protein
METSVDEPLSTYSPCLGSDSIPLQHLQVLYGLIGILKIGNR